MCTQPALVQWTVSTTAVTAVWLHCRYRALVHHLLFYPRAESSPHNGIPADCQLEVCVYQFTLL